jgi:hypothetical protein
LFEFSRIYTRQTALSGKLALGQDNSICVNDLVRLADESGIGQQGVISRGCKAQAVRACGDVVWMNVQPQAFTPRQAVAGRMHHPGAIGRVFDARGFEGAVAAPTAGLHFSKQLSKRLEIAGINMAELTLHIGLGTFRTVEVEDLTKHKTDSEQLIIPEVTADLVNDARAKGKRVCAVGTTTLRAFESSVGTNNTLKAFDGWASKFIFPPYDFQIADSLITNFHEPQSVLLMMTTAFGGYDFVMEAYKEAIKKKYRFFCYGDAMLII